MSRAAPESAAAASREREMTTWAANSLKAEAAMAAATRASRPRKGLK